MKGTVGAVICAMLAVVAAGAANATTLLVDAPPAAVAAVNPAPPVIEMPDGKLTVTTPWGAESRTSTLLDFRLPHSIQQLLASGALGSFASTTELLDIAALPEISTWAMMIGGLGLVGFAMRRTAYSRPLADPAAR